MAYVDKNYDVALEKIKNSFAVKARFIARCIRLAARITKERNQEGAEEKCLELEEYMLRIIDAFLSGGDYLPYRQVFQKTELLAGLVIKNKKHGNLTKAAQHMQELIQTRDAFFSFLDNPESKHCLMFLEGDEDGVEKATKELINARIEKAQSV